MTVTYEKYTSTNGTEYIRRNNENGSYSDIPVDEANADYQAYLSYVANGNKAPDTLASELSNPSTPQAGE